MSVSNTDKLDRLDMVLYDRPAGRNIIAHAIDTIHALRERQTELVLWKHSAIVVLREYLQELRADGCGHRIEHDEFCLCDHIRTVAALVEGQEPNQSETQPLSKKPKRNLKGSKTSSTI